MSKGHQILETGRKLCRAIKRDGTPCNAPPCKGLDYCFHHSKERRAEAEAARRKATEAARQKRLQEKSTRPKGVLKRVRLNNLDDVRRLLASVITEFREGKITADDARVTAYVANILIGAIKDSDIESRLRELEDRIREKGILDGHRY